MLCSTKELNDYHPAASDGEIGRVRDVLFDDRRWGIRHLVVDTGGWLSGREVLVSPHAIERVDRARRRIHVALTRQQIQDAPGIETDQPVSRRHEMSYYDYYGFPYDWAGPGLWGAASYPMAGAGLAALPPERGLPHEAVERAQAEREAGDEHLRSGREVTGYDIAARDGDIGHLDDFLFDDRSWQIRYAVVDTRNWLPGRLVLVSPDWIEGIDWGARRARVRLTREAVESSPPYDRERQLEVEDESRLANHYAGYI
jgi:hypothetical protein